MLRCTHSSTNTNEDTLEPYTCYEELLLSSRKHHAHSQAYGKKDVLQHCTKLLGFCETI